MLLPPRAVAPGPAGQRHQQVDRAEDHAADADHGPQRRGLEGPQQDQVLADEAVQAGESGEGEGENEQES